jgi:type II secretory pathway pseudopilin PulG
MRRSSPAALAHAAERDGRDQLADQSRSESEQTYEASARIERELVPNVALSGGWVYHRINNLYFNTQINRPYDQWVPATPATPFLDQNGQPVTVYTYPASLVGSSFNLLQGSNVLDGRPNVFHSLEVAATKRYSNKWTGSTSFWMTKNHSWLTTGGNNGALPQSPNDDRFPINNQWDWEARANGTYRLPFDINVTGSYVRSPVSGGSGRRCSPAPRCGRVRPRCAWVSTASSVRTPCS